MMMMSNEELSTVIATYAETEEYVWWEAHLSELPELSKEQTERAKKIYTELVHRNCARNSSKQKAVIALCGMESRMFYRFPSELKLDDTRKELESLHLDEYQIYINFIQVNDSQYVMDIQDLSK